MLLEEFDADKYERCIREEGLEEGEERMASLMKKLLELNRMEDLKRIATDVDFRERLLQEFGI